MPTRNGTRNTSKKIVETLSFKIVTESVNHEALLEQMIVDYDGTEACELPILLSCVRALAFVHQVGHWTATADTFYGDHLLFERLYNSTNEEVDKVAEKAIGTSSMMMIHPVQQVTHEALVVEAMCSNLSEMPTSNDLTQRSYEAEMHFLGILELLYKRMETNGTLSLGVDNFLQGLADNHEASIYLLKQRMGG